MILHVRISRKQLFKTLQSLDVTPSHRYLQGRRIIQSARKLARTSNYQNEKVFKLLINRDGVYFLFDLTQNNKGICRPYHITKPLILLCFVLITWWCSGDVNRLSLSPTHLPSPHPRGPGFLPHIILVFNIHLAGLVHPPLCHAYSTLLCTLVPKGKPRHTSDNNEYT